MDIEKLIERLGENTDCWTDKVHGYADLRLDAAAALSTLQDEKAQLREELEYEREHANAYHEECGQWEAENEKLYANLARVTAERDAAISDLTYIARTYPVDLCDDLVCQYCKHYPNVNTGCPGWTDNDCFEWRGIKEG